MSDHLSYESGYDRMMYGYDAREWVRAAKHEIPRLEARLTLLQRDAAGCFEYRQSASAHFNTAIFVEYDVNREKYHTMYRLMQMHGMMRANAGAE